MNKKLVAVAIAGLLAAPLAQAQTANVTLYGRLNLDTEFVRGAFLAPGVTQPAACSGANARAETCITTNPTQYRVSSNSSRFGLRGTESLGGGLNAIFQIENGSLGADNTGGTLAGRDTFVGLQGRWGTFKMGFFHLPYDNIIASIYGSNPTLETGILAVGSVWGQAQASKANGSFDARVGNTIRWDTPVMSGWQGMFTYSIGGAPSGNEGAPRSNSSVSSGGLMYNNGPIMFGAAFQYNAQWRQAGLSDLAWSVAGRYQFPKVAVGVVYERLDYDCANIANAATACQSVPGATGTTDLTRDLYGVDVTIGAGPGQIYANWQYAANGKGGVVNGARIGALAKGDNTSVNQWSVSYTYPLSKRTSLFTGYTQYLNKSNASYTWSTNSYPASVIPGSKPQGFSMGMWHNF